MAKISLTNLKHSYSKNPSSESEWALKQVDQVWEDGGAYALLGSSGCGKTTLLNMISGLLHPTTGDIFFDDKNVTQFGTQERNIAQVFQFPVVYDTMTVYENLAFPLRNRKVKTAEIDSRVREIAEMLDLGDSLSKKAAGLTADGKQKISLGRGLVRSEVNAILFDEPLTVIDPHLKWQLRSKLKELHLKSGATMIYVTHDQTEALTFADKVMVMHDGEVVQAGTPVELFDKPKHTFVGHFIGSPGMNLLPGKHDNGKVTFSSNVISVRSDITRLNTTDVIKIGIRPEFVQFSESGIPVNIVKINDIGRDRIVTTEHDGHLIKLIVSEDVSIPDSSAFIEFDPTRSSVFRNDWLVDSDKNSGIAR